MEMTGSKELLGAQAHIWSETFNYMTSMALRCAVQLGIPDIMYDCDTPLTLPELVTQLSISPTKSKQLHSLMMLLVHTGFFAVKTDDKGQEGYVGTYSCKLLSNKHQANLAPFVITTTDPGTTTPCMFLADWFKGNEATPFDIVHGMGMYGYGGEKLDASKKFNDAMAGYSELTVKQLVQDLKLILEGFESLVDVGGGTGVVAKAISEAIPDMRCTVYDLPRVISEAKGDIGNVTLVPGDMFQSIPSANVILLKDVLIDWGDEDCLKILRQCREAISRENGAGKVIIVDTMYNVWKGDADERLRLCFKAFLVTYNSGTERTEDEWKKMFSEAGFSNYKITSVYGSSSVIEVFP